MAQEIFPIVLTDYYHVKFGGSPAMLPIAESTKNFAPWGTDSHGSWGLSI